jgi:hypothetical protein
MSSSELSLYALFDVKNLVKKLAEFGKLLKWELT